ncbi:ATP synthase subunit delta [Marinithermofilum abyssi]|uniref:ATP synthase subunit delta n=1 Tax=Marinithermofilum abyssi TaxID=1571185 RepID=A0A8J2VFW1_9BACL|nr:F0F1 ATP synthase subunit delta [Marinithermofilum abyssi]GGE05266.1 ATP synthase subunit delta [Marinithermofilum abyssi]
MSQTVVAKRYAKALFEAAQERQLLEQVEREWRGIAETWAGSEELRGWLSHPTVNLDQKKQTVNQLFGELSDISRNLLYLLLDRGREAIIGEIYAEYKALVFEAKGIAEAEVISAAPLSQEEKQALSQAFEQRIGKKLNITNRVDSDLLGGVIVRIGDRLYDGCLRGKLARFQKQLAKTHVG